MAPWRAGRRPGFGRGRRRTNSVFAVCPARGDCSSDVVSGTDAGRRGFVREQPDGRTADNHPGFLSCIECSRSPVFAGGKSSTKNDGVALSFHLTGQKHHERGRRRQAPVDGEGERAVLSWTEAPRTRGSGRSQFRDVLCAWSLSGRSRPFGNAFYLGAMMSERTIPTQLAKHDIEDRRQEQSKEGHSQHSAEHRHAHDASNL